MTFLFITLTVLCLFSENCVQKVDLNKDNSSFDFSGHSLLINLKNLFILKALLISTLYELLHFQLHVFYFSCLNALLIFIPYRLFDRLVTYIKFIDDAFESTVRLSI